MKVERHRDRWREQGRPQTRLLYVLGDEGDVNTFGRVGGKIATQTHSLRRDNFSWVKTPARLGRAFPARSRLNGGLSVLSAPSEAARIDGKALSATDAIVWWIPLSQGNVTGYQVSPAQSLRNARPSSSQTDRGAPVGSR